MPRPGSALFGTERNSPLGRRASSAGFTNAKSSSSITTSETLRLDNGGSGLRLKRGDVSSGGGGGGGASDASESSAARGGGVAASASSQRGARAAASAVLDVVCKALSTARPKGSLSFIAAMARLFPNGTSRYTAAEETV